MSAAMNPVEAACPQCHARLDVELLRDTGGHTCPFCDAGVSAKLEIGGLVSERREAVGVVPSRRGSPAEESTLVRPLPPDSRLEVVQAEAGRLVLLLPPGGRGGNSLWGFAIFFSVRLGFIPGGDVTPLVGGAAQQQGNPLVIVATLGGFWLVALGLWWGALKMRYQRTLLSVDRERVVLQTTLFGKTRQQELPVQATTECSLEEAYSVNEVPVYRVRVANSNQSLGFATNLDQDDKDWLVDQIEMMLENSSAAESTAEARLDSDLHSPGVRLSSGSLGSREEPSLGVTPLSPGELPRESVITILEDRPDQLRFSFPAVEELPVRIGISGCLLFFIGPFFLGVWWMIWNDWKPGAPMGGGGAIGALGSLMVILFAIGSALLPAWMRTTVRLTREVLECHWSLGPLLWRRAMSVDSIEAIVLGNTSGQGNPRPVSSRRRRRAGEAAGSGCTVTGAGQPLLLAPFAEVDLSRQVAGLLLEKLQSWGQRVEARVGSLRGSRPPH
jgi:hypothetical protein